MRKNYDNTTIDQACRRALYYNSINYGTVKKICERGLILLPVDDDSSSSNEVIEETEITRNLSSYDQMTALGVIENE